MKSSVYESNKLKCTVTADDFSVHKNKENVLSIIFEGKGTPSTVQFDLEGEAYIVWPNREGEGFYLSEVHDKLIQLGFDHCGLSISYPATASMTAFLVKEESGEGFFFCMPPELEGRVRDIQLLSKSKDLVTIKINAIHDIWHIFKFNNTEYLSDKLKNPEYKLILPQKLNKSINISRQFQLGLIGPDGSTEVPDERGFLIISDIAQLLSRTYGSNGDNIIHIFGYGVGHDRKYPCYQPSDRLGSVDLLRKALDLTRKIGFKTSFYLNGRIMDKECLEIYPELASSVMKDNEGFFIVETYFDRKFYVMDPSSSYWQDCLVSWAEKLADWGADAIQLDQLGGRNAAKAAGEIWGEGYCRIINKIHNLGLSVWIQGISDLYNADWFEMTFRELNILDGGVIRGGNPFGENDLSLIELLQKDKTFLMTEYKKEKVQNIIKYNVITDFPDFRTELPLYGKTYMEKLKKAVSSI